MREYKVGDIVIWIDKRVSNRQKKEYGVSLYGKLAKIIYIDKPDNLDKEYFLEFKDHIKGFGGIGKVKGKEGHCMWCSFSQIKSVDHLKFKKWVKG